MLNTSTFLFKGILLYVSLAPLFLSLLPSLYFVCLQIPIVCNVFLPYFEEAILSGQTIVVSCFVAFSYKNDKSYKKE